MSFKFVLGRHVVGPVVEDMKAACAGCGDFPPDDGMSPDDQGGLPALKPNVAIIIIGLGFTLILVAAFAVFAKFMRPHLGRQESGWSSRLWEDAVKDGNSVDTNLIKTLPLILYSRESFIGLNLDLECAVCLSQFEDKEELRLLPNCKHMFHPICIDSWLRSHPSCPLCRSSIFSSSWTLRHPTATGAVVNIPIAMIQSRLVDETQQNQQRAREDETAPGLHHLEITVESIEARFEALRDSCCGRKTRTVSPAPESTHHSALEETYHASEVETRRGDLEGEASTSGRGIAGNSFEQPVGSVCIGIPEAEGEVAIVPVNILAHAISDLRSPEPEGDEASKKVGTTPQGRSTTDGQTIGDSSSAISFSASPTAP